MWGWLIRCALHRSYLVLSQPLPPGCSYVLINMAVFGLSYIKRSLYSQHLMKFSSTLSFLTSIMITLEVWHAILARTSVPTTLRPFMCHGMLPPQGYLMGEIDSPYMIIVLIVYLVATNVSLDCLATCQRATLLAENPHPRCW